MEPRERRAAALDRAAEHAAAGRVREAAAIYDDILAADPDDAEALYRLAPIVAGSGDLERARAALLRVVALEPGNADALSDLGALHRRLGDADAALAAYRAALAIDPGHIDALYNCANALKAAGQGVEAADHYRRALARDPGHLGALNNLGLLLHDRGAFEDALSCYRRALAIDADIPELHNNLGNALKQTGAPDEAVACYRRAVGLRPEYVAAWTNLSVVLADTGRTDEAIEPIRRAIALAPDDARKHTHLGSLLMQTGRYDAAEDALDRAVGIDPDYPEAHWNRANLWLLLGRLRDGWAEYEWRLKCSGLNAFARPIDRPRWTGEPLDGRTVLIHGEQGLGDTIQFVRYLPQVAARGGRVLLQCQPALARLLDGMAGCDQIVASDRSLPAFDCFAPLLSLPHLFGSDHGSIPAAPYLRPPRERLLTLPEAGGRRVGLAWAGRRQHGNDRNRSIPLARLAPLFEVGRLAFFSLQVGDARSEIEDGGFGGRIADLGAGFSDFAVTASAVEALDLVVSVDTAVAHLAGALGRPVWLLLPFVPDWRWMLGRDDTPWYPTMRLFRQPAAGDWDSVIADVAAALRGFG